MADEGFDALSRDHTSEPGAGIDEALAELTAEERPRDETGKFAKKTDGADPGDETPQKSEPDPEAEATGEDDDAAPEEASGEEDEDAEPETAIDAPASWSADAKEVFAKLPPEAQEIIAQRESERESAVNARLAESAAQRKAADAEREAAQAERQHNANFLAQVAAYARTMDPIIAKGMSTDWAARAREVGADEAYAEQQEFNQRVQYMQAVEHELQRINQASAKQRRETEEKQLRDRFPDYADAAKLQQFKDAALPVLTEAGYTPEEVGQYWEHIPDHRQALILDKAVRYDRLMAERKALQTKKAKSPPPKVQKPRAQQDAKAEETARVAALRKQTEQDPNDYDALTELAQRSIGAR